MTQREKLVAKIRRRPPEADFDDVRHLLESFGWHLDRERGSHTIFTNGEGESITVPKKNGRTVKRTYLDQICQMLGLDD